MSCKIQICYIYLWVQTVQIEGEEKNVMAEELEI